MGKDLILPNGPDFRVKLMQIIEPTMFSYAETCELYWACENLDTVQAVVTIAQRDHLPLWAACNVWAKEKTMQ